MPYTHATLGRWSEKASYYHEFVLYPAAVLAIGIWSCRSFGWLALLALGFVLFTFAEYWVHRVVLHRWFYHATHMRHHAHPREFVIFPVLWIPLAFALALYLLPAALVCGFALGWWWFSVSHHAMHHWDFRWVRAISRWHDRHHKQVRCNFGITHPLWDIVFRTYRSIKS